MIEHRLFELLNSEVKETERYHNFIGGLYRNLYDYIKRSGKRLASCSTLLVYKGFTDSIDNRILDVCAGIELYRHAILVHDDLVDEDELRRGASTIHKAYSREYDARFGEGLAVFAGNILYTLSLKALNGSGFDSEKKTLILNMLNDASQSVNESQILDLLFENKTPNVGEWYVMASKRAASLFKASLGIGALLAEALESDYQSIEKAAENIGYSFDIQDDIIDTYASEKQYGRKPGGDLLKHKKPLHIVYTYLMADESQLAAFKDAIDQKSSKSLNLIRRIISESGALEEAKNNSRRHAESAKTYILGTSMSTEVKNFFTAFIDYVKDSLNWYM